METLKIDGSLLTASADDRILTYRLLTYGEAGRTNRGTVVAHRGVLTLPEDPTTMVANLQHDKTKPVSRFVSLTDTPEGLNCSVRPLNTSAGNDVFTEALEGVRRGISVEVAGEVIRNGQLLGGVLTGAGHVTEPAFPSSLLVAADAGELPDELPEDSTSTTETTEEIVINGVTYVRKSTAHYETTTTAKDSTEPADKKDETVTETTLTAAAAPSGLGAPSKAGLSKDMTSDDAFRFLADAYRANGDAGMVAALSDITVSGIGANLIPPAWISELWSGRTFTRRYVPLVTNVSLKGMTLKGWKWTTKPAVAAYAGNKAAVTSNTPVTAPVSVAVQRLAGAHDVDRAYRDFDVTEFWESYYRAMTDSYAMLSDNACITDIIANATAPAAPGSGLSTWTPAASIIDGAMAVIAANGTPSAAIVGTDLYRALLLTPAQNMIELLTGSLGLKQSEAEGFVIIPGPAALLTKALVLDKGGFVFAELPGSPIRVEAINQANAGIDPGVFGYFADYATDPLLLQLISKPTA